MRRSKYIIALFVGAMLAQAAGCGVLLAGATGQSIGRSLMMEGGKLFAKRAVEELKPKDKNKAKAEASGD